MKKKQKHRHPVRNILVSLLAVLAGFPNAPSVYSLDENPSSPSSTPQIYS